MWMGEGARETLRYFWRRETEEGSPTARAMALLSPGQRLVRARLVRVAARSATVGTCIACASTPSHALLYTAFLCLAILGSGRLATLLQQPQSGRERRAIGLGLCVLGAVCATAAAAIIAMNPVPAATADLPADQGQAAHYHIARGGRRALYEPLWWIPSFYQILAFFLPLAAAAMLHSIQQHVYGTNLPDFGLQSAKQYEQVGEAMTEEALRALIQSLRRRGLPANLSEHARERFEMTNGRDGLTGVLRSEALRWVRHAAADDERAYEGCGFRIAADGSRIDEEDASSGDSDSDLAEEPIVRQPPGSPLRSWDYRRTPLTGREEPPDDPATWNNLMLVKKVARRVRQVTEQQRTIHPAWLALCKLLEDMWDCVLPGL